MRVLYPITDRINHIAVNLREPRRSQTVTSAKGNTEIQSVIEEQGLI